MGVFDPSAFGRRIRAEMERLGLDIKALQEDIRDRTNGARGTSYGSVWSYVNGQAPLEPRREVVEAMAEALGVLPNYLLYGQPPRTKQEAAQMAAREEVEVELVEFDDAEERERWRKIFLALREAEQESPWVTRSFFMGREEVIERLVIRLLSSGSRPPTDYSTDDFVAAFKLLMWLIMIPGIVLGGENFFDRIGGIAPAYFMAMATAFELAIPGPYSMAPCLTLITLRLAQRAWEEVDNQLLEAETKEDGRRLLHDLVPDMPDTIIEGAWAEVEAARRAWKTKAWEAPDA